MTEPRWLNRQISDVIHHELIVEHGGATGARVDADVLSGSALARPKDRFAAETDAYDAAVGVADGRYSEQWLIDWFESNTADRYNHRNKGAGLRAGWNQKAGKQQMKIGSHVSFSGKGLRTAATEAIGYGATSFMIYTGAPQNTRRKPMENQFVPEGLELMRANSINEIVVHAPYIINLASYRPEVFELAVEFLQSEIMRTDFIGQDGIGIVLHPGAFTDRDVEFGLNRIVEGLNEVLSQPAGVNIALETMAGKGTEIGRSFEELAEIISRVDNPERLRVCFDTCHVHDAGYDIVNDFDGVMEEFDRLIGIDRIAVFHINDSKNPRGARKDRHAPLGAGQIGYQALHNIVHHEVAKGKPVILETPWIGVDRKRTRPMYEAEIALLTDNVADRFGAEFAADVERVRRLVNERTGATGRDFVLGTWNELLDRKARLADPREPMRRLYDLVIENDLFPGYTEEQVNHRLIGYFAGGD